MDHLFLINCNAVNFAYIESCMFLIVENCSTLLLYYNNDIPGRPTAGDQLCVYITVQLERAYRTSPVLSQSHMNF